MMQLPEIKLRIFYLLIITLVAWLGGLAFTYFGGAQLGSIFPEGTGAFFVSLCVFSFGFLFFGFPTPVIMFFVGLHTGILAQATKGFSASIAVMAFSSFLSAYVAIRMGDALLDDMTGRGNFKSALFISMMLIFIALAISGIVDLLGIK
jgi:hypothetical protein